MSSRWRTTEGLDGALWFVRLAGDLSQQSAIITELRREATGRRGSAVLLSASGDLKARLGPWGPIGDAASIMRAVKSRFDPRGTLNPGRGAWECAQP